MSFYTLQEAAAVLRVSEQTMRRYVKSQKVRASKPGGRYLIPASELERFLLA